LVFFLKVFSQDADDELDRRLCKAVKAGCFKVYDGPDDGPDDGSDDGSEDEPEDESSVNGSVYSEDDTEVDSGSEAGDEDDVEDSLPADQVVLSHVGNLAWEEPGIWPSFVSGICSFLGVWREQKPRFLGETRR
jgi:hypothetical protein